MRRSFDTGRTMRTKSAMQLAEWSVHLAEIHVLRQIEHIEELKRDGHSTLEAEAHLRLLEETWKTHQQVLDGLLASRLLP